MTYRAQVELQQTDEYLADDAAPDRTETAPAGSHIGLTQDVVPERRLTVPTGGAGSDFVGRQRPFAEMPGDRFSRGQPDPFAALEIAHGERAEFLDFTRAGDCHRQGNQRSHESSVELPSSLRRRISRRIEDQRPVDLMAWRDGLKSQQVWKHRHGRRTVLKKIAMSDLPVSVAIRRIRELERDERHLGSVVTAIAHHNLVGHLRSDERRQEFLHNGYLIVTAQLAGGGGEHV